MNESPTIVRSRKISIRIGVLSVTVLASGVAFAPEQVWSNLLIGAFFLLTISLGGAVFLALAAVSGAGWHIAFRRVPESLATMIPLCGIGLLLVIGTNLNRFGWHYHGEGGPGTFWFKEMWLNPTSLMIRSVIYVFLWSVLALRLVANSRRQDRTGDLRITQKNAHLSALFLACVATSFTLATIDWLMSLEPMWFSTIWGIYHFAGLFQATLAAIVLACILLAAPHGPLEGVFSLEHLHDLGKLLLGFSCFWMYLWFCQYMLIWYSNIPEETSYFIKREQGIWGPFVILSMVLNWGIPFFVLLPRPAKRSMKVMTRVALVVLIGRWVDLYVIIIPAMHTTAPPFGLLELATIGATGALTILLVLRAFAAAAPVPRQDPFLSESLHYHSY